MKLSTQDKKDLDKYTKFLALKATQIIVQSRVGEKVSTPCKANTLGSDWVKDITPNKDPCLNHCFQFNLSINDLPDVYAESKKKLNQELVSACIPFCVEISLRTSEGDQMVLESWSLCLLPEQCDPTVRIIHTVYNRMGILLKSLVSVTRVTPAYKLSRRQGPDSYVICYRVYMDQPELHCLGDGYKQVRIGQICTPIGTLQLSVAYRTKMTISPTQTGKNNSIMVKSDHFNSNSNLKKQRNNEDINDLTKPMRPGAFAEPTPKKQIEPELPGVTRLLALGKYKPRPLFSEGENVDVSNNNNNVNNSSTQSPPPPQVDDDLRQENGISAENGTQEKPKAEANEMNASTSSKSSGSVYKNRDKEFWMKGMVTHFANPGTMEELMEFYKQCKMSPPLESPPQTQDPEELTAQFETFESELPQFDAFVKSLYENQDN